MPIDLKSERESGKRPFEVGGIVDEERGLIEGVFVRDLTENPMLSQVVLCRPGMKPQVVKQMIRVRVDSSVLPVTLVVTLNHRLVDGGVIRRNVAGRLWIGFLHPAMDHSATALDT